MQSLIQRHGGEVMVAPSMREIPLEDNPVAIDALRQAVSEPLGAFVFLTGVGTDALLELADSQGQLEALKSVMQQTQLIARGPKPAAALKKAGFTCAIKAGEPNTWRELMLAIEQSQLDLQGKLVAVQEYGMPATDLHAALQAAGAQVLTIPVYRWELPQDLEPLQAAIQATIDGQLDILMFTSAQQIRHVLQVADDGGVREAFLERAGQTFVASIGPTCSEALVEEGLNVSFEASPPKMGPLVRGAIQKYLAQA
jgi:uroporphyrinogen-III synthase